MDNLYSYNTFLGIGEGVDKTKAEAELVKANALANLANKPAQSNSPLFLLIPVAGLLVLGTIFIVISKRKKR